MRDIALSREAETPSEEAIHCFSSAFLTTSYIYINCENYCTPARTLINQNHFTVSYFPVNVISLCPGEEEMKSYL